MENRQHQWKVWEKCINYPEQKIPMQIEPFNPSKIFTDGTVAILNRRHTDQIHFTKEFKEKVFPFMDTNIHIENEFYYDVFWDKYSYHLNKEDVKGDFTEVIKPFQFDQFWGLLHYLAPKTDGSGESGLLGDLFDHVPKTFIRLLLPSSESVVVTMRPFTRGDFTDEWIGVQIDCIDEKSLKWEDFTLVKLFSLRN